MADPTTLVTLRRKLKEIAAIIKLYEQQLNQAKADYASVNAALRIFETEDPAKAMPRYMDVLRLFGRKEKMDLCKAALAQLGPLSTKELGLEVVRRKEMNPEDKVLVDAITHRLVHSLRIQATMNKVEMIGKRGGVCVWRLPIRPD
ncbi:MAG: hypothetical protein WBD60_04625, partial [Methylovirgula sp.]